LRNEAGEKFGYQSLFERMKRLGKKVGISWLSPHKLRHTFGTYLKAATGDFYFVIDQLGHKRKDTTSIYAKTPDDEAGAKMEKFHNRLWCDYKEGFLP
jgi:integrase